MFGLSPVVLGLTSLFLGVIFFLLIILLLHILPRFQPIPGAASPPDLVNTTPHEEAVLLVQSGGRLVYLNAKAREFFNAWEREPNLENLASRTRPDGAFLALCACEGKAQFSINGTNIEGTSYFAPGSVQSKLELFSSEKPAEAGIQKQQSAILVSLRCSQLLAGAGTLAEPSAHEGRKISKEAQPSTEMTVLANLAQAVSSIRDVQDLYTRLIEVISPLIPVETLGFMVYDENCHVLEAQTPFKGIPSNVIESYATAILPGTPGEVIWQSRETIVAPNAADDARLASLGLVRVMQVAGIRQTVMVPLISGGRMIGYLQAANKEDGAAFDQGNLRLLNIIAGQAAPIIENSILFRLSRYRAQRAETLLRIIRELSVSLDLDQVLRNTLQVLREYVDAEQITILIARPNQKKLHRLASVGYTPRPPRDGAPTPFDVDQGLAGWIISQRKSALIEDVLHDERWIQIPLSPESDSKNTPDSLVDAEGGRNKESVELQHRSAMGVPLMSGAEVLGCLLLFHREAGHFSEDQLDLVQAAAIQVSVAVNNAELYRLIRDQAEDLGNMFRAQQVETSRSKAILEAVADGVLVTDAKRRITLFNESAERILGLDHTKVEGKSMEDFTGLFGRATHMWMETIRTWSQDPSTYHPGDVYSEQIILEDGRVVSVHLAPVSLGNDFLGTVSIFQDITHQVEVDRLKSEFVATVSHELRTPMTSIKGYIEILLMGAAGSLNDQQAHFLKVARDNTERLTVLVNDLLDISQIESGRVTLSLQPLNLEYIADQAIADLKRRKAGDEKSITVVKEAQPSLPQVMGDAERIERVFDNLLENAYQYNTPGGKITIAIHRNDGEVQVDIEDTGVGIHPEDQERVFERFYRGENPLVLGVSGTGLGLPIVKNLIEMHKGRIWLKSAGAPFLSLYRKLNPERKGRNEKRKMAKILIAEDERDIRDLIAFTLNFAGHQVISTNNGEEACQKAVKMKPDLILLDVRMPRMSGYETCQKLKAHQSTKDIPVVFLSAKGQESEVKAGIECGAEEYIVKPFSPDKLTERINKILARGRSQ
jgi:PAS domain S-box-containing protein